MARAPKPPALQVLFEPWPASTWANVQQGRYEVFAGQYLLDALDESGEFKVRGFRAVVAGCTTCRRDAKDPRVTVSASDVLREGVGICWAKANLLAALLRANGVPAGFGYQKLTLGDTPDTGYCIHALNTVYLASMGKWIRLDARGNTGAIHAEFSTGAEKLAFPIRPDYGELDYRDNRPQPSEKLMRVLKTSADALYMYLHLLPDALED